MPTEILPQCPHVKNLHTNFSDIIRVRKYVKCCEDCKYSGPNLWVCLKQDCLRVGCSEQANDHSTSHFQSNIEHCVHINISSQRSWCYICEKEIFLSLKLTTDAHILDITCDRTDNNLNNDDEISAGLVGLQNIANTCYMNSALQALSNVPQMTHYFLNCSTLIDHVLNYNAHRNKAGLAKSYQRLLKHMWCKVNNIKDHIAPRGILYGIRSVNPMFRGYQQHDTQEFLRCFMDQLHEELKEQSPISPFQKANHLKKSNYIPFKVSDEIVSTSSSVSQTDSISDSEYESCQGNIGLSEQNTFYIDPTYNVYKDKLKASHSHPKEFNQPTSQQTLNRSIVSDIFDGKLLSSVQCLTCDRISTREETFQDLSLPIPNRDYLNVLHSNNIPTLNIVDNCNIENTDSWFSWIWNMLRSWLWGPSVTLYDCMASFFSADELKGDNMYSCEKCNKLRTGIKYSQILELPEVMCIHLKRFRHDLSYSSKISSHVHFPMEGFDMKSFLHKDYKSNISTYNLVSVICHHGTVGGGHYTCFAKNDRTNQWYEYDDHHVTLTSTEVVQNCQAYVLFYKKINPQIERIRSEASELSELNPVDLVTIRFYVSREWLLRFNTFAEPGPINNWAMLCPHGGILHTKRSLISHIAVPISQPLWDFLYERFGGGPVVNMLFECEICKRTAEALSRRQNYELSVFTKYNEIDVNDSGQVYAISMPWLRKWQLFARGLSGEPGPIINNNIALTGDQLQTSLLKVRPGSDYAQISGSLWRFLYGVYGGGPEIQLRGPVTEEVTTTNEEEYDDITQALSSDTESNIHEHFELKKNSEGKAHKRKNCLAYSRTSKVGLRNNKAKKNLKNRKTLRNLEIITKDNCLQNEINDHENVVIQRLARKFNDGVKIQHFPQNNISKYNCLNENEYKQKRKKN